MNAMIEPDVSRADAERRRFEEAVAVEQARTRAFFALTDHRRAQMQRRRRVMEREPAIVFEI